MTTSKQSSRNGRGQSEPTKLAEFVRHSRKREGLTQAEFARRLGSESAQYVSKIETGRIAVPSGAFLEALAAHTGQSVDRLLVLSRKRSSEDSDIDLPWDEAEPGKPFKLLFGHCMWGAPIFLAAHRGMIPQFSVASYSLDSADSKVGEPCWIVPDEFSAVRPGPGSKSAAPWSAVKILDLLEKEKIDIGAVPGNIIWGRGVYQRFMRIGTVVDSATGCTFVCDARKFPVNARILSTRELYSLVSGYVAKTGKNVRVAVEAGTVADNYLYRTFETAEDQFPGRRTVDTSPRVAELLAPNRMRWHCDSATLAHTSFAELQASCAKTDDAELLGVITWEPHASWLEAQEHSQGNLRKIPLHFSPDRNGQLALMSFDLVMLRTSAISRVLRVALTKLMQKLWQNATLLSELDGSSFDQDPLSRVADYFGFTSDHNEAVSQAATLERVWAAIQSVRYSVHWAMESQSLMGAFSPAWSHRSEHVHVR